MSGDGLYVEFTNGVKIENWELIGDFYIPQAQQQQQL